MAQIPPVHLPVNLESVPRQILDKIALIREKKGKGEQTLALVDRALIAAQDYIVRLYLEKVLVYQHEVMEDKSKPEAKQDKAKQKRFVKKMEDATDEARIYVKRHNLGRWEARIQRFLGRVADYKGKYPKAITHYKKAIATAKKDPEYATERIPRWLEYEAFLAYSTLMSGEVGEGLSMSRKVYKSFDITSDGKFLKRVDYPTWAIWKTGIPIRVGFWFLEKGGGINKKELLDWLAKADEELGVPKTSTRWVGKVDFGFRLDEIAAIRREIAKIK